MYSLHNIEDIIRCYLCDTPIPLLYCEVCHINICKGCAVRHLSDDSKEHTVVPVKQRKSSPSYSKQTAHAKTQCELHEERYKLYCKQCDIPICTCCLSSSQHLGHDTFSITEAFNSKKNNLQRDLQEFEQSLLPKYQDIISSIKVQYEDLETKSKDLIRAVHQHGEDLHKEIDNIINMKKS